MNEKSLKFTIVYQSRQGTMAGHLCQMAMYLWQKGVKVSLCSTSDFAHDKIDNRYFLMLREIFMTVFRSILFFSQLTRYVRGDFPYDFSYEL